MDSTGNTPRSEPEGEEEESRFLVRGRVEIAFILKSVMQAGEIVTAYFNEGRDFAITALLAVDGPGGFAVFDANQQVAANQRLLSSKRISFVTNQDKVKVQFATAALTPCEFEGRPALRSALPETLYKYQRREYYRVPASLSNPLQCVVPRGDSPALTMSIVDISIGGVCLTGFPETEILEPGMALDNCRIDLPEIGVLTTSLRVRNSFEIPLRNGLVHRRAGCKFSKLSPASEAMIQRYIIRLERDRRSKFNDG